jgi:hypothetical protein
MTKIVALNQDLNVIAGQVRFDSDRLFDNLSNGYQVSTITVLIR